MKLEEIFNVKPSGRQLRWQQLEFYGFIHFGMNTMTGVEWGKGHEDLQQFSPEKLDAGEWVSVLKAAGMKAVILTCKHHDGFCLWPSRYSEHTVAGTPWRGGAGDLVQDVAEACRLQGLVFGVYLSPWDRTEQSYGEGTAYDDFYVQQLTELLTNYGEIGCVWLDGANGEGPSGKRQYYDWDRYYETIRRLQPECVISVCGPDIRWVGNEAGQTRAEEWSVVPKLLQDAEKTAEKSQQADDGGFSRSLNSMDEDLGSRAAIAAYEGEWVWYPAEVNTSIRPGWFYHEEEDTQVRSDSELFGIYLNAVGGNATFLLNIPPTREGLIAEPDRRALEDLGRRIAGLNDTSLMSGAEVHTSSSMGDPEAAIKLTGGYEQPDLLYSWQPAEEDSEPWVEVSFPEEAVLNTVILQEQIMLGQRVEAFELWAADQKEWSKLAEGTIIGYKKIIRLPQTRVSRLKVVFKQFRGFPTLTHICALYMED
ncbi:alpha-L-fucosidase [Paenibacillus sp. LMG 31459]|uniref:alpha-L-fucosidase n=1 Tax=Paenibacillus phytohabitans TaxID=2654978 RepID=A0ABX1YQ59_9BACL|nr:alpha-L-fucosidase [Paenibacillus phytohabitans]NOU82694.1 alpha-L-fucosidase [Paenibacillus phytohabitans]